MLKCYPHSNLIGFQANQPIKGSVIVPGAAKKLIGVALVAPVSCVTSRDNGSYKGFVLKLIVNNREDNPLNYLYHDGYLSVFDNLESNRFIDLDVDLKPQTKINYVIIPLSTIDQWQYASYPPAPGDPLHNVEVKIKLYLKYQK